MTFYFLILMVTLILSILSRSTLKLDSFGTIRIKSFNYFLYISLIFLVYFLVAALRYNVGTDYIAYQDVAKKIVYNGYSLNYFEYEVLFVILTKISYEFFGSMQFFYAFIAFVTYYYFFKAILYYNKFATQEIVFFFLTTTFFISLNAMRQMVAFSIFFYASKYILEKKYKKYIFYIFFALLWHKSAMFYFGILIIWKIDFRKYIFFYILFIIGLKSWLNLLAQKLLENYNIKLAYYFSIKSNATSYTFIFLTSLILLSFILFVKIESEKDKFLFLITFLLFGISIFSHGTLGAFRLIYMLWPYYIVICPYIIRRAKDKFKFPVTIILYMLFMLFFYRAQILNNSHEVVPYNIISIG